MQDDWFLLAHELKLQRAHAKTLHAARIVTADELAALLAAVDAIEQQYGAAACPATDAEDLHTWIEQELVTRAGAAGRKIHTARSRNDQVATLLKLYVIDVGARLAAAVGGLVRSAGHQAEAWAALPMPLMTHQQFAAPGSVGFWMLRYATSFQRIHRHLGWLLDDWRQECPLGGGAVAGSSIPIDRTLQAHELGFAGPSPNALATTSTRDECLELLAVVAQCALHLQSFATDVIIFSQTPLAWTKYPVAFGTGSSMMPNKRNPDAMELLRGEASQVVAAHGHLAMLLKGLPSGYNRDLQCCKPLVRDTAERLVELLGMTAAFVAELAFDEQRLAESMQQGHINATLRMEESVQAGEPLRNAHHVVAKEVLDTQDGAAPAIDNALLRYATTGSTHPDEVRAVAQRMIAAVGDNR